MHKIRIMPSFRSNHHHDLTQIIEIHPFIENFKFNVLHITECSHLKASSKDTLSHIGKWLCAHICLHCTHHIISISNTVICQTMHQIFLLGFAYDTDVNGDRGKWQNNRFIFHEMDYAHIEHEREETSESCGQRDGFSIAKAKPWITLTLCMVSDMMISRHLSTSL